MKKIVLLGITLLGFVGFSQTIALQSFATGFSSPVEITHPVNDSRLFVLQRFGLIKILNADGTTNATPFLDVSSLISTGPGNERGLLGLAFHPDYANNGYFFIDYTNTSGNTVIARYSVNATNPSIANTTGTILMTITQPYSNHNGGCLRFGPDGYLYIGMGDGGSAGDPGNRAQNINENLGKILRIDVNSTVSPYYTSPATNPYVGVAGNDEIWAIGIRNPWKFSFNRLNGDLWIADVGQDQIEEVNKVTSPQPNNLNFGWKCYEGNATYSTGGCPPMSNMTFPVAQYLHSSGGCSITGGYVYTGTIYPNFANKYFYSDYCDNKIRTIDTSNNVTTTSAFTGNFVAFGEDSSGELYVAGITNGVIYKIIDSSLKNSEFEKKGFALYPNPTKEFFTIKSPIDVTISNVTLYDLSGKLLLEQKSVNAQPISIGSLTSGMYIVTVETSNGEKYNSKLIVE